jgi:hypothetical protein
MPTHDRARKEALTNCSERRCHPLAPCVEVASRKPVPLYYTLKTPALGVTNRIHIIPRREQISAELFPGFDFFRKVFEIP